MRTPEPSGAVVIAALKQHHRAIPVIAISGPVNAGQEMDADAAIALGWRER